MDVKIFTTIFLTIFVAELGDKTQIATLLYASDKKTNLTMVFIAASSALVLSTAIGVVAGGAISNYISAKQLNIIAGLGFIAIGLWTLFKA